jgi:tetratricopeptide (TPR) repeat protein
MRTLLVLVFAGLACAAGACAPKVAPTPPAVVFTPKYPDFIRPPVPQELAGTTAAASYEWGWRFLQAGDLRNAEREFAGSLKASPGFYPAEAGAGYLELARNNPASALPRFDRALERQPEYVSALVGRGEALASLNRESEAAAAFAKAAALDASLGELAVKAEVLRFRGVERDLAAARDAARAGRSDDAVRLYETAIATSPESGFLYRELAVIERKRGNTDQALSHFRQAAALDPTDTEALTAMAELLEARGEVTEALAAYESALAVEPSAVIERRRETLRARVALAALPEQYRAIETAPEVTRGDLAALIALRLGGLLQASRPVNAALITDVRAHWAEPYIMDVARAGVMDPYENHTFQPRGVVRRVDLAEAVSRLLSRVAAASPAQAKSWQNSRGKFSDVAASHLAYAAVSAAVASGVISVPPDGAFQPARAVTGAEAVDTIRRLETLANPAARPIGRR